MEPPPSSDAPDGSAETYHHGRKRRAGVGAGIAVAAALAWACLRWRPSVVKVEGGSMAPTLAPDDRALVVSKKVYVAGDVVVVEHPDRLGYEMVKRLVAGPGAMVGERTLADGEYWVEGDMAAASTDSRQFGPVGAEALKAKVVLVYGPKERRHLVR